MHALLEILTAIFDATSCLPWPRKSDDRSVVGESEMDRSARRLRYIIWFGVAVLVLIAFFFIG